MRDRLRNPLYGMRASAPHTRRFERQEGRRTVLRSQAVLSGIVVVKATPDQLQTLRDIDGISDPIKDFGETRPLRSPEVAYVFDLTRNPRPDPRDPYQGRGKPDPKKPPFFVGQSVQIRTGAFIGFKAKVEYLVETAKKWRIKVEVMIFGRPTPVELDPADLLPA